MTGLRASDLWHDQEAVGTVEYAILLALIALTALVACTDLGARMATVLTGSTTQVGQDPNPGP